MYKRGKYIVQSNELIAKDTYKIILNGDTQYFTAPGQFVNIEIDGFFLRRPISVCDYTDREITLIYKVVGQGTKALSHAEPETELDMLTGLGNGFDISKCGKKPLLIGGGVGVPPMYALAKALVKNGTVPTAVLGFNDKDSVFYVDEFKKLGVNVIVATVDGSVGVKGFVTTAIETENPDYDYFCTCGPEVMMRALCKLISADGQLSFEERMACGFGACMGCSCKTKYGNKRICKDGPVMQKDEIIWD